MNDYCDFDVFNDAASTNLDNRYNDLQIVGIPNSKLDLHKF